MKTLLTQKNMAHMKSMFAILMVLVVMASMMCTVFAETHSYTDTNNDNKCDVCGKEAGYAEHTSGAIEKGIKTGTLQLYNLITAVTVPVAALVFVWSAFKVFTGGEKGMEQAKKTMLITVVVIALVYIGPLVVEQVAGWFKGTGNGATSVFD